MPEDNYGNSYSYKSSGTIKKGRNEDQTPLTIELIIFFSICQGNHYCARDYGDSAKNSNSYHYSNADGSYYYSNPNGSTYYNSGTGYSSYTPSQSSGNSNGNSNGGSK